MPERRVLVAYYSRTGRTRKVAEALAKRISAPAEDPGYPRSPPATVRCDIEEIKAKESWAGALGYMRAGRGTMKGELCELEESAKGPGGYDIVVVGTPVWVYTMSIPVRAYLLRHKGGFRSVAFFITLGSDGAKRTFAAMEEACGRKPLAAMKVLASEAVKGQFDEKIGSFARDIVAQMKAVG